MDRLSIINYLIKNNNYTSYCNLGVFTGYTLDSVLCIHKVGVDPSPEHYRGNCIIENKTSDDYFKQLDEEKYPHKFDIFFVDAMHLEEYVLRDISNCLRYLSDKGKILLHDCLPSKWEHAQEQWLEPEWNGTVYKAILRFMRDDIFGSYTVRTVNTDYGCTIIEHNEIPMEKNIDFEMYDKAIEDFNYFLENKEKLFNIITPEEFYQLYS